MSAVEQTKKIALAGVVHETNTYCQGQTPRSAFYTYRGAEMLGTSGQHSDLGGAVDACLALGCEIVPILYASTQPSGTIERDAYDAFKAEILDGLAAAVADGLDGCVLLLHGAGVVDGIQDLEGDLAHAVRAVVGDLPIAASFDLHGNVTQDMADALNGIFACHHYPHIDMHERAAEAVQCVVDIAEGGSKTVCQVINLPLLLPTTTTYEGIGQQFLEQMLAVEATADCRDVSWFHGFPYTDIAHVGSMLAVTYAPDDVAVVDTVRGLAQSLWDKREAFRPKSLSAEEALAEAQSFSEYPVVIHETSDNCGGGSPGDGTHLLRAMLDAGLGTDACFGFVVDAEVAAQAHQAGTGSHIQVTLGGKTDDLHGPPLLLDAYVKALHDGRLVLQHMFKGAPLNIGPMARLVVDGLDIVVASRRSQTFDREPFLAVGIDVMKYKYVALKSSNHFRAGFQHLASGIVTADTPGLTTHDVSVFSRQQTQRRLWPIDAQAAYPE